MFVFDWHFVATADPSSLTILNSVLESFFLAASSASVSFFSIKAFLSFLQLFFTFLSRLSYCC